MREKVTVWFAGIVVAIMIPYLITIWISGTEQRSMGGSLEQIQSGKTVQIEQNGEKKAVDVECYLVDVLAAEIAPDSEMEAIKAQAVIARTTILKEMEGVTIIQSGDLSAKALTQEEEEELWGSKHYHEYRERLEDAVEDTLGQTLEYEGDYIDAMYHPVSIGQTAKALEICGKDIPYLQSVESSADVTAKDYMQLICRTPEELATIFSVSIITDGSVPLEEQVKVLETTEHGYVNKILIGGQELSGQVVADKLYLPSTNYSVEIYEGKYRFVSLGVGHGMGLSVYGANAMAKEGKTYDVILKYYYTGVTIRN